MKNVLKYGYFLSMLILTILTLNFLSLAMMGEKHIEYRSLSDKITGSEMEEYNASGFFEKKLEYSEDHYHVRYDDVRETRIRKGIYWETQVDTLKTYVLTRSYN